MMIATDPISATLSGWAIDRFSIGAVFNGTAGLFITLGIGLFFMFSPVKQKEAVIKQSIAVN
jgi:hypothetical protein